MSKATHPLLTVLAVLGIALGVAVPPQAMIHAGPSAASISAPSTDSCKGDYCWESDPT